jgi:5-hydroxyisourate hydrolase
MSAITTHVLDVSIGRPAAEIPVRLDRRASNGDWEPVGSQKTDADGRARELMPDGEPLSTALHRLTFEVGLYFTERKVESFYHEVTIAFRVTDPEQHYHVPLLLSPFGYSTYRGS